MRFVEKFPFFALAAIKNSRKIQRARFFNLKTGNSGRFGMAEDSMPENPDGSRRINRMCIVGPGRLGASLAARFGAERVCFVHPRPDRVLDQLPLALQSVELYSSLRAAFGGEDFDALVLCVGDAQIRSLVAEIAELPPAQEVLLMHCAGSLGREVFDEPTLDRCWPTAAAHPFQTFADRNSAAAFDGIAWGVEADAAERPTLAHWIAALGGSAHFFDGPTAGGKALYHAAAVAASNVMVASVELARALSAAADIPAAKFLAPIMRQSLGNALAALNDVDGPLGVLTGPIVRGDVATIRRHMTALQDKPALRRAFAAATRMTAELAHAQGGITRANFDDILSTLRNFDED